MIVPATLPDPVPGTEARITTGPPKLFGPCSDVQSVQTLEIAPILQGEHHDVQGLGRRIDNKCTRNSDDRASPQNSSECPRRVPA